MNAKIELTKDELITIVFKAFPYNKQINSLDTQSNEKAILFVWRSIYFDVSNSLFVTTVPHNDTLEIITKALLERTYGNYISQQADMEIKKEKEK